MLAAAAAAAAVTCGLFLVMQSLIAPRWSVFEQRERRLALDFVRLERDEQLQVKKRRPPEKVERRPPPPAALIVLEEGAVPRRPELRVDVPRFDPSLALAGGPYRGVPPSDTDAVPMVRIPPRYPVRAQARGIEGWVIVRFSVTPRGTTADIEVVDAEPRGYFERAAVNAVKKYKYKPMIEEGVAVARHGMELMVSFELED